MAVYSVDELRMIVSDIAKQYGVKKVALFGSYSTVENNAMPWREIKTMRNIAAHNYGEIDIDILWETATGDIPDLKEYCKKFIA